MKSSNPGGPSKRRPLTQEQRLKKREIDRLKHRTNRAEHKARLDNIEQDVALLRSTIAELTVHLRKLTHPAQRLDIHSDDAESGEDSETVSTEEYREDTVDADEIMRNAPAAISQRSSPGGWSASHPTSTQGSASVSPLSDLSAKIQV